jgi:hypothetical protein
MSDDGFASQLGEVLTELLARGFQLPLHMAIVASNGAILGGSYEPDSDSGTSLVFNATADNTAGFEGMAFPVNVLYVDPTGKVVRVTINASGKPVFSA